MSLKTFMSKPHNYTWSRRVNLGLAVIIGGFFLAGFPLTWWSVSGFCLCFSAAIFLPSEKTWAALKAGKTKPKELHEGKP